MKLVIFDLFKTRKYFTFGASVALGLILVVLTAQNFQSDDEWKGVNDRAKTKGSLVAPVQIIEFSDFQCPSCKHAQPVLNEFLEKYKGKVRVEFFHFPLDGHQWARVAHQAAECAAEKGKFWEFHDLLFEEQAKWSGTTNPTTKFIQYANQVGLEMDTFGGCLSNERITEKVYNEKKEGIQLKIRSTPTFFINGKRFVGGQELKKSGEAFIKETLGIKE